MPKPRSGFAALVKDDKLFVIGGNDGKVLNSTEYLDLNTYKWNKLPPLIHKRDELAVALGADNKIYAVGGYGGSDK